MVFSLILLSPGNPHTGEYLAQVMKDAMEVVKSRVGATVVSIVTDNASNMEKMRAKILDTSVFTYGCQAHVLNLIAKDLLEDKEESRHRLQLLKSSLSFGMCKPFWPPWTEQACFHGMWVDFPPLVEENNPGAGLRLPSLPVLVTPVGVHIGIVINITSSKQGTTRGCILHSLAHSLQHCSSLFSPR